MRWIRSFYRAPLHIFLLDHPAPEYPDAFLHSTPPQHPMNNQWRETFDGYLPWTFVRRFIPFCGLWCFYRRSGGSDSPPLLLPILLPFKFAYVSFNFRTGNLRVVYKGKFRLDRVGGATVHDSIMVNRIAVVRLVWPKMPGTWFDIPRMTWKRLAK